MFHKLFFVICFSLFFLLTGCTTTTSQKTNCISGQNGCYTQYGKKYQVIQNSHQYQEQGVASWYGRRFNHKRTSSGERYNMYSMTAAHKTLPLSTYVQVTNLSNGRTVVVKVNDRGPFASNRLIDVSYAAAKKLHMIGEGTVPVLVKALTNPTRSYRV